MRKASPGTESRRAPVSRSSKTAGQISNRSAVAKETKMELAIVVIVAVIGLMAFAHSISQSNEAIRRKEEKKRDMEMLDALLKAAEDEKAAEESKQRKMLML